MNAYIYKAAIYCEDCGHTIQHQLLADGNGYVPSSWPNDSELWPQGPYVDGGGEADSPTHCDQCLVFLENPLTTYGEKYTVDIANTGTGQFLHEWRDFYAYLWDAA